MGGRAAQGSTDPAVAYPCMHCMHAVPPGALLGTITAGPRSWTFAEGERKAALQAMLDAADVVCMTEEEAVAVTGGLEGAEAQAQWVLGRPGARTEWVVIKRGAEGAVLASRSHGTDAVYRQQALQVDVRDTGEQGWSREWAMGPVLWSAWGVARRCLQCRAVLTELI